MSKIIVVGGGLAGLSAAHTVLEHGGNVLLLDKNSFLGGNSTKATSGINGALTRTQVKNGIKDSVEAFLQDTIASSKLGATYPLAEVLTEESGPAVEWLIKAFGLDLSLVSRLGGHSFPRTHRGKERFPGMTITYALMEKLEAIAAKAPTRAKVIVKARVTELIAENGEVVGCKYEYNGKQFTEMGPVIIATGGYASDFGEDSLLRKYRPDIYNYPTTNGPHATGDGIKMAVKVGAELKDIDQVQVHPTGLVHPDEPDNPVKFLAAEALRGVGALMLDKNGERFCNELGRRDYVSGEMTRLGRGPYRLVLNGKASAEIEWHCKHYTGRKLMKRMTSGAELAKEFGISADKLKKTFDEYNKNAEAKTDQYGKQFYQNGPWKMDDLFHVAVITPVRHYCMGGLKTSPDGEVEGKSGPIAGLYCTGEVMGGTHGKNRLGGSSLLDCVVFGRVAGRTATRFQLAKFIKGGAAGGSAAAGGPFKVGVKINPNTKSATLDISWDAAGAAASAAPAAAEAGPASASGLTAAENAGNDFAAPKAGGAAAAAPAAAAPAAGGKKKYTAADVAKHNTDKDCWVIVNGEVLDVTKFLDEHPGGKQAIMLFAGRDATDEFNMLHKPDVVAKYAPDSIIGVLDGAKVAAKL